ncbi:MAG: alternate-type signal peptide domain-containing protein [Actinomycetaceae bacterium]
MRKKTVGALAGAAAAAVALGSGGTFALWSDNASVDAGTIQAGNLDIAPQGNFAWYDATLNDSPGFAGGFWDFLFPRHDVGHPIDRMHAGDGYRVVPGDIVVGYQDVVIDLHGDNLRAHLTVGPGPGVPGSEFEGLEVEYGLWDEENGRWIDYGLDFDDVSEFALQADGVNQEQGEDDWDGLGGWYILDRESTLTVVVVASFDEATSGQTSVNAQTALDNLEIELEQSTSALPIFD